MICRGDTNESGAAATELALLCLVLVPLLLYAAFFLELGVARVKSTEAARFVVWELAAMGLSDFQTGDHAGRFLKLRRSVLEEVQRRWGDDLQSATPDVLPGAPGVGMLTLKATIDPSQISVENVDADLWRAEVAARFPNGVNSQGVGWLFEQMGFARTGKLEGAVKVRIHDQLLGPSLRLLRDGFEMEVRQSLLAETWSLRDGDDVIESGQDGGCRHDYCHQLQRMHLPGLRDQVAGMVSGRGIGPILGMVGMHDPRAAVIASRAMRGGESRPDIDLKVFAPKGGGHDRVGKHLTNTYRDTFSDRGSPYAEVYRRLGPHYLGCPQAQMKEGECRYDSR
ncbi:MAG: hypothetical protein HY901_36105 [Deltaproteobacteria bacterium]|nr:hypothetical protein [Deltaproteobacteria bacterium]